MFSKVDKPHKSWDQNKPIKSFLFQRRKSYSYFTPIVHMEKTVAFAARLKEDDGEFFGALGDSC